MLERQLTQADLDAVLRQFRGAGGHGDVQPEVQEAPVLSVLPPSDLDLFREAIPAALRPFLGQYAGAAEYNNPGGAEIDCQHTVFRATKH